MTTDLTPRRPPQETQAPSFVQVFSPLLRSGIPSDELHVYLLLCDHAGRSDFCWPSDRTIGDHIGKSRATVQRIMERLQARGLISRTEVSVTAENPTGRVITVHRRVRPPVSPARQRDSRPDNSKVKQGVPHGRTKVASTGATDPVSPVRHEPDNLEKPYGQAAAGEGPPAPSAREERSRDALLKVAWRALPEATRAEIAAAVKAENPGLARWPNLIEPLCLVTLQARLDRGDLSVLGDDPPSFHVVPAPGA